MPFVCVEVNAGKRFVTVNNDGVLFCLSKHCQQLRTEYFFKRCNYFDLVFIDRNYNSLYNHCICILGKVLLSCYFKEKNVKSKKLLALIIVVAVLIVIIVVFVSIFAVRNAEVTIRSFDGGQKTAEIGDPTADDVLEFCKGKSIVFLSKSDLTKKLNEKFPDWHVVQIVKKFPNTVDVHIVKRVAVVKLDVDGGVYLDSFGYVVDAPTDGSQPLDITSAIKDLPGTTAVNAKGQKFQFVSEKGNKRLDLVLQSIMALWQCKIEIEDIPTVLNKNDVFTFTSDGDMEILTKTNVKIIVESPNPETLSKGLIDAFSVYYNDKQNLQQQGFVITVKADGSVTTHKD